MGSWCKDNDKFLQKLCIRSYLQIMKRFVVSAPSAEAGTSLLSIYRTSAVSCTQQGSRSGRSIAEYRTASSITRHGKKNLFPKQKPAAITIVNGRSQFTQKERPVRTPREDAPSTVCALV